MVKIMLASHGNLAAGMLSSAEWFLESRIMSVLYVHM